MGSSRIVGNSELRKGTNQPARSGLSRLPDRSVLVAIIRLLAGIVALSASVRSQEKKESGEAHMIVHFADLKWTPIQKGCELAPVYGDPNAEGASFVLRIRCGDGIKIPAHWHPTDEYLTVLKGTFLVAPGEAFDEAKLQTMNVGNFAMMPKEMRHFALCKGETIVQIHGTGPFVVNWVNPSDFQPPDAPTAITAKPKN